MSFHQGHVNGLSMVEIKGILLKYWTLDYVMQWWGVFILNSGGKKKIHNSCYLKSFFEGIYKLSEFSAQDLSD